MEQKIKRGGGVSPSPNTFGSDFGDVDGGQVLAAALLPDGEDGPGGVNGGDTGHRVLHGGAADLEAVAVVLAALGLSLIHIFSARALLRCIRRCRKRDITR